MNDAQKWRLKQAAKVLDLFKTTHRGRAARDNEELTAWLMTPEGKATLARHLDKDGKIIP